MKRPDERVSLFMRDLVELQKKIFPEILEVMQQRYSVLNSVRFFQPIGRRGIAENTKLTERIVRNEIGFLSENGLIDITSKGMYITNEGKVVSDQLTNFMREAMGVNVLEQRLKEKLQVGRVIIVSGNSDKDDWVKQEMGKECIEYLKNMIQSQSTIAVTGGTTMTTLADMMVPLDKQHQHLFVPARGGLGEKVENQANTIVAEMARKAKGDYRLLYVPDPLSETSYQTMINEPSIVSILALIKKSDIVIHSIGDAFTMANRRKTTPETIQKLKERRAVGEAFGYYFDKNGQVVHTVKTIGIQIEDLRTTNSVITIAGGETKAQAIVSYFKNGKSDLLITDEAAAKQILRVNPL